MVCSSIYTETNYKVSAIAVAPVARKLFFCLNSDSGTNYSAKIVKTELDGSGKVVIAQKNVSLVS